MRSTVNLHILRREFASLAESVCFDNGFKEFSSKTLDAIDHVLAKVNIYPDDVIRTFEAHLWNARKFVRGSRASDTPYEVQFALRVAYSQWTTQEALISNAELEDVDFFLNRNDLWSYIKTSLTHYDTKGYEPIVVRIGAPSVYKHRPVFCIPLFHELGHFVDLSNGVSAISMVILHPVGVAAGDVLAMQRAHNHRMEHFADLFSACYCDNSLNEILVRLAGMQSASYSHPSTAERISVVSDFLAGQQNDIVDLFQAALLARGLPALSQQFVVPNVSPSFDDVRTFPIASNGEFFGLFPAAWRYLEHQLDNRTAPWIAAESTLLEIESTVNDLAEKSLRNYEIKVRWNNVTSP